VADSPFRTFDRLRDLTFEAHALADERKDMGFLFHGRVCTPVREWGRIVSGSTLNPFGSNMLKLESMRLHCRFIH
jgi:hypothetical protein